MSFSAQVKNEICAHVFEKECCIRAFCYGAACFAYTFTAEKLEFHLQRKELISYLRTAFNAQGIALQTQAYFVHGRNKLALRTAEDALPQLTAFLKDCGAEKKAEMLPKANLAKLLHCPECTRALLAGAFLCGGVVANPEKEYHLEFLTPHQARLDELELLLNEAGFEPRRTRKNANFVLYLRASEQIEDLLTCMGASHSTMEIMNEKIYKNYRNQANRITNCETANIDKTVSANQKVILAVELLQKEGVLATLPEPLQQAAAARAAEPDLTLAELAALLQPPVSKSGLSHRLKKLVDLAARLEERRAAYADEKNRLSRSECPTKEEPAVHE